MLQLAIALGILTAVYLAIRAFAQANPATVARRLRTGGGIGALALAAILALRGNFAVSAPLASLAAWLLWGQGAPGWPGRATDRSGQPSSDSVSRVATDHLEMELDTATGAMRGRVLKGFFAGRDIDSLRPVELAHLWQDCRFVDPASAQLVEAYLDRVHPSWREDLARAEAASPKGPDGRMTPAEALEILGLGPGADAEQIREAHRNLMLKLHPDRGGSTYLAAKINEAKEVALAARG